MVSTVSVLMTVLSSVCTWVDFPLIIKAQLTWPGVKKAGNMWILLSCGTVNEM